jgi:hypothetical protein
MIISAPLILGKKYAYKKNIFCPIDHIEPIEPLPDGRLALNLPKQKNLPL